MGSKPSKSKNVDVKVSNRDSDSAVVVNEGIDAKNGHSVPDTDVDATKLHRDVARESLRALHNLQVVDEAAIDHLNEIIKIFYTVSRTNIDDFHVVSHTLLDEGILRIFIKFWDQCHENPDEFYSDVQAVPFTNMNRLKILIWNYSDKCKDIASACFNDSGIIERIIREFSLPQLDVPTLTQPRLRFMVKANLGILHNLLRHANQNRNHIRKNNGIDRILAYEKSSYLIVKAKVFIVLAYCINEEENSKIMAGGTVAGYLLSFVADGIRLGFAGSGVIAFILQILESASSSPKHVAKLYAFSAEETVAALNKLASNDENKKAIVDAGVLPILTKLLDVETSSASEHLECVNCLWSLAFHKDNKQKIIEEPDLIAGVKKLRTIDPVSPRLKKSIESLMFVLDLEQPIENQRIEDEKHIMLSYNWDVQHVMLKLRDYLSSQGINIWMDVDKIHDSILSAMAEAVENSALIVVAMTESYKNSNSCRTEAEYAYQREVPILPLLLQPGYKADGWLGAMVGTKLYVNLSSIDFEQRFPDVLREIHSRANAPVNKDSQAIVAVSAPPLPVRNLSIEPVQSSVTTVDGRGMTFTQTVLPCQTWSVSEVRSWCSKVGIKDLKDCDGGELSQLCKLLVRSPDVYYRILREDLRLNLKDLLSFTNSVESLLG